MTPAPTSIIDITLAPGEFHFGDGDTRIHTLLGSCVAITMWHPQQRIGGMCHYLLPARGPNKRLSQGHFADDVIDLFLSEIKMHHTRVQDYEVKLFGGGNMFASLGYQEGALNVSGNNVEEGARLLQAEGFRIKAKDVGGILHRKIYMELWNGDVWVQRGPARKELG